jgi:Ca2+/Na+ antiporter
LDAKVRNEALKVLFGATIVFFVFVMIVTPQYRANWVGVLVGSFIIMLFVVAFVYGQRGSEEEDGEEMEEETPQEVEPSAQPRGPTTIIREREVIREIVMLPCKYCGALMPQTSVFCPHCGARRT